MKNPDWFREYSTDAKPGVPLPYHENLGLTQDEYTKYIELWDQRKMQPVPKGEVAIRLEQAKEGEWVIRVSGLGTPFSLLRYYEKTDEVRSTNGMMKLDVTACSMAARRWSVRFTPARCQVRAS